MGVERGTRSLALSALAAWTLLTAGACASTRERETLLFCNGRIYLGGESGAVVDALLVSEGRVLAAGGESELLARSEARWSRRIDLRGATAIPGLQDAHGHWEGYGASLETVDLRGIASYELIVQRVAAEAALQDPGSWIQGRGWDQNLWSGKQFPEHGPLSAAVPDHPVVLRRVDGHALLANQRALEIAGLWRDLRNFEAPAGGAVHLDDRGAPTGVLIDAAMDLILEHVPPPDRATRRRRILRAQEELLSMGLTAVHDMGVDPQGLGIFAELRAKGLLKLREIAYLADIQQGRADVIPKVDERDTLCVAGVKFYADGALGSRGAALLESYSDAPLENGLLQLDRAELDGKLRLCASLSLQPAVHAIGDRANRLVLDACEEVSRADPRLTELRPRIEHAQIVAREDWPRFEALGVIPSVQPTHATSDMPWVDDRIGSQRLERAYPWRRLQPQRLALGSDFPVESPNPFEGLYAARTRQDARGEPSGGWLGDQCLTAQEALHGFTEGAAYAAHQEDRRGRLVPGCFADITVLDVDPIKCEPAELLRARVHMTVINGEIVYESW